MQLAIGSDETGIAFKELLKTRLTGQKHAVRDVCTGDLEVGTYHAVADRLAFEIRAGNVDRAVLICSRAVGASVAANKHPGVRAAICHEPSFAQRGVEEDNLNFLVVAVGLVSADLACQLADAFINALPPERQQLGIAPRKLSQIIEYVKDNLDSPLTVCELSRLAGLSESQFSKLFKLSTGLAPHQFILQERINCSKEFLRSGMSIVNVALDVGFSHQAHFTTVFKNLVGMTPRQYQLSSSDGAGAAYPMSRAA